MIQLFIYFIFSVLSFVSNDNLNSTFNNISSTSKKHVAEICGAKFCPGVNADVNPNLQPPDPAKIHLLTGIFLGCMIAACLIIIFGLDSVKRFVSYINFLSNNQI